MDDLDNLAALTIVNRALRRIGAPAASSMADTARAAARAIEAYTRSRDEILRAIHWPCCTMRKVVLNENEMACPWVTLTRFEAGYRATNDSDKTYICTTAGITGATGPTGTGTGITDGTCVWNYVEASDATNNWCHWPLTDYVVGDIVAWANRRIYVCITAGTTGAASPPTTTSADITDGTVHWMYYGTLPLNRTVYAYQYIVPENCLKIQKVPNLAALTEQQQGVQFSYEQHWLYCNQDESFLKYTLREEDPTNWDALLQACVALRIATEIVFDITGQKSLTTEVYQEFGTILAVAKDTARTEGMESEPEPVRWEDV